MGYNRLNGIVDTGESMGIQWTLWNSRYRRINGDTGESMGIQWNQCNSGYRRINWNTMDSME